MEKVSCPLCRLYINREIKTALHYEDGSCIIVDCITCDVPMAVYKSHVSSIGSYAENHIRAMMLSLFGVGHFRGPRKIKDHWHLHFERR